ncbi:MAG: DUF2905 domain-containing protein [Verrucomicrobiales bacterium]
MLRNIVITVGIILVLIGLFWPLIGKLPLFRLPGDIVINKPGTRIYLPITSMIVLSLLLTLLFRLFK